MAQARVHWLSAAEGGRTSVPRGPRYSSVARFAALADLWPQEAWSVVLTFDQPIDEHGDVICQIALLVPENAPAGLLDVGSQFDICEGRRWVAKGEILAS